MNQGPQPKTDILIVDDRDDGLTALEAVLGGGALNVVRAQSGQEALALLDQHDFAAILLDVQMPEMDGFECAARIKQLDPHRLIPIIFVTAINKDDAYVYKGYEHGAVDYVFKPFDGRILSSKVSVFVELHKKTRLLEAQAEQIKESERRERYLRLAALEVESLKRYRNLADSIPHSVWRAKADGTMDYFNHVWMKTTGLSAEQSAGLGWQLAFNPRSLRDLLRTWMKAMESGLPFQLECQLRTAEGPYRWHLICGVPEKRSAGEVVAWLGTCTDINDRKETEDRLIEARKDADAANSAKTQFLANMSHEIRTPLNAILGFAELMNQDDLQTEAAESLKTIQRNGKQLLNIIDEILDISKVEANRLELEDVEVDLRSVIADVHSLLSVQAREKKLALTANCRTLIPEKIRTDPTRLRQILINMIGNALKFTAEGGVHVEMSWAKAADEETGLLRFIIRDTGVGIDSQHANRLFQPFMQADSSTTRKFGGTGLGLALSRKLAIALGGDVRLETTDKGKGSTFAVEIRVPHAGSQELWSDFQGAVIRDAASAAAAASAAMRLSAKASAHLKGLNVLVVDDALDNRTLISRFLMAAGASVDCAVDGNDGMDHALKKNYDVVLMDIQMPQLDGYSATTRLRAGGYMKPIIALTAHALKEERESSLRAGCNDHLTKPIDRSTLINRVAQFGGRAIL